MNTTSTLYPLWVIMDCTIMVLFTFQKLLCSQTDISICPPHCLFKHLFWFIREDLGQHGDRCLICNCFSILGYLGQGHLWMG